MSKQTSFEFAQLDKESAKLAVIELAVKALGRLAMAGPMSYLTAQERAECMACLFDALEVLNDEKEND